MAVPAIVAFLAAVGSGSQKKLQMAPPVSEKSLRLEPIITFRTNFYTCYSCWCEIGPRERDFNCRGG